LYFLEYEHLNKTLDEIDSWMTTLESRNDSLYSQLQELLKSSKETRQELQMMNECHESNGKTDGDKTKS
jgi:septation ring formation regulator EzrA